MGFDGRESTNHLFLLQNDEWSKILNRNVILTWPRATNKLTAVHRSACVTRYSLCCAVFRPRHRRRHPAPASLCFLLPLPARQNACNEHSYTVPQNILFRDGAALESRTRYILHSVEQGHTTSVTTTLYKYCTALLLIVLQRRSSASHRVRVATTL